jgi:LysR family nitrogen assimilation transcriptional regulator
MEIKQIRYFMWVYEEGSFSKAAQKARVAQPVLSMQIRRMEDEFGVQLFERHARGIKPTEAGLKLYHRCVLIMQNVTAAEKELQETKQVETLTGKIHVGLPGIFNRSLLKDVILPFVERYPEVDVTVSEAYTGTLVNWVRDGLVDFALAARPLVEGNLVQRLIYKERVMLMSGAPLFGPSFTPCDLTKAEDLKLILPTSNSGFGAVVRDYIDRGVIKVDKLLEINGVAGSLAVAQNSDWAVLGSFMAVVVDLDNPRIFTYPVAAPNIPFDLYIVYDRRRPLSAAARLFVEIIEHELHRVNEMWDRISQLQLEPPTERQQY